MTTQLETVVNSRISSLFYRRLIHGVSRTHFYCGCPRPKPPERVWKDVPTKELVMRANIEHLDYQKGATEELGRRLKEEYER